VSFHYQADECLSTDHGAHPHKRRRHKAGKGACFLLKKYCDPEPNDCFDGYFMDEGARASEVHLTEAAAAGDTKIHLDSIHGLKTYSKLICEQETQVITGFHPITLEAPLQHDYAVGSTCLVTHNNSEEGLMDREAIKIINGGTTAPAPPTVAPETTTPSTTNALDPDNKLDPAQIVTDTPVGYELFAENTGKRWCRGPDDSAGAEFPGGEDKYTSGEYEHIADIPSVQECAAKCTENHWCLGFNYKHSGNAEGFEEKACQLVSQMHLCLTDVDQLDSYTKGVYVVTPGETCTPALTKHECEYKVKLFGQELKISTGKIDPTIEDAPPGCFRDADTGQFYWGDTGNGDCSALAPCLCA
jgi:hypothetical protein